MSIGTYKKALYAANSVGTGRLTTFLSEAPNLSAGDAEFLDPTRPHELQIRPMLKSERTPGAVDDYPPGAHWLVWQSRTGRQIRALVNLPYSRRKNVRSNALHAVGLVERFNPAFGALFRLVAAGCDPFTDTFAVMATD